MEGEGEEKNRNLKIRKRKIKRIETAVATQAPSVTETSRRKNTLFIVESAETSQGFFFFFFLRFAKSTEPYGFQFRSFVNCWGGVRVQFRPTYYSSHHVLFHLRLNQANRFLTRSSFSPYVPPLAPKFLLLPLFGPFFSFLIFSPFLWPLQSKGLSILFCKPICLVLFIASPPPTQKKSLLLYWQVRLLSDLNPQT